MNTTSNIGGTTPVVQGSLACSFDSSRLTSLLSNRNTRFHLDLSDSSLMEILEASEQFHRKTNPAYSNSPARSMLSRLQKMIGQEILPIDITDEFYVEVQEWLLTEKGRRGEPIKPSTVKIYFDCIKAALSWARKHNCQVSETYDVYKVDNYMRPKVALTPSQIAHIYYFKFEKTNKPLRKLTRKYAEEMHIKFFSFTRLEKIKDQFVLDCQLGQRHSDIKRMTKENFDETGTIYRVTQQKTEGRAVVNLAKYSIDRSIAFEILKKYDYTAPMLNQDISMCDHYLHLLCRVIGGEFDQIVPGENKIRGKVETENYRMWQLITTHTARRTFVTYWANNKEMSIARLQRCTGHKDARQITRYTVLRDDD